MATLTEVFNGTSPGLVEIDCQRSAFINVEGTSFSAELRHQFKKIPTGQAGAVTDYNTLKNSTYPTGRVLSETDNYTQTLGAGRYALNFTASTGTIIVSVTQ